MTGEQIIKKMERNLKVSLLRPVEFVFLNRRHWVESAAYPYFTLAGQAFGSIILAVEALFRYPPHIFVDTMGYPFSLLIFRLLGQCRCVSYIHYPTISTDMLVGVNERRENFNNSSRVSQSQILTTTKLAYYYTFSILYGIVGRMNHVIMVNSSWTKGQIDSLFSMKERTFLVFPPCDTSEFQSIPVDKRNAFRILSIGQFRPEKNHRLQIESFSLFFNSLGAQEKKHARLVLVGGCRDAGDERRVEELQGRASALNLEKEVISLVFTVQLIGPFIVY